MKDYCQLIEGGIHEDDRGKIYFSNECDLSAVKRFYHIHHFDTKVVRAWQGHKLESKWFHCIRGAFDMKVAKINDWNNLPQKLLPSTFILSDLNSQVLYIPKNHITGFRAIKKDSILMVYSNFSTAASKLDDYRFDKKHWDDIWEKEVSI